MSALTEAPHSSSLGAQAAEGSGAACTYSAPSAVERGGGGTRAAARGGGAEKQQIRCKEDEVAISEDPQQRQRRPLSFSRWFAREARATDVFVVLAEMLIINWLHAARLGEALHCGEGGAAAGSSSGTSSSGSSSSGSSSSSSGSSPFPCGGGLWSKLLWSLSSGAVLDPVLRLRMWDYSNIIYTWTQLAVVLIALLVPVLYERCRHALMAGAGVAMLLGVHWSLWAAPPGPFPLNSCVMLSAQRRRIGCVYMGWKSATVFRVPASAQLVTGPLLWLLMAAALPMTDRRMPPPGSDAGGGGADGYRRLAVDTLLLFLSIAVLPYVLCRIWEAGALRPAYQRYLRDFTQQQQRGTIAGASSPTSSCCWMEEAGGVADAVEAAGSRRAADTAGTTAGASGLGAGAGCDDDHDGGAAGSCSEGDDCSPSTATSPGTYGGVFGSSSSNSGNVWACRLVGCRSSSSEPAASGLPAALEWPAPITAAKTTALEPAAGHTAAVDSCPADFPPRRQDPSSRAPTWEVRSGIPSSMRLPVVSLAAAAPPTARATPASGQHQAPPAAGVLYRSSMSEGGGGLGRTNRTALVSIKVPVRHRGSDPGSGRSGAGHSGLPAQQLPTFEEAAALVLQRTGAALKSHNRRASIRLQEAAAIQPTAAGAESVAVGSRLPAAVPLRCLSAVCVEGCVQLLMVVHFMAAGVAGEGQAAGQEAQGGGSIPLLHHMQLPHTGGVADGEPEAAASLATGEGVSAAVQQLLTQIGAEVEQMTTATGASAASASDGSSVTAASTAAPAFCWPPALPLLTAAPGDAPAGAEVGGAAGEGDEAVVLLLQLPAGSARGLRSVRCVLAGPAVVPPAPEPEEDGAGEGGGGGAAAAIVHMDVELPLRLLQQPLAGGEAGGVATTTVSAYVRLPVPPRVRMGAGGLRMMYVLPPPAHDTAAGTANAASAKESPFTTTTIRPTWLAAEHGAEGTTAFPAASSLVSVAPSAACGDGAGTHADAPAGANTSSVSTNATVNASAAASGISSARNSMSGGRDSTAPLAVVPLLVVGSEAAAELQQLHGQVLGDEAVTQLHQLTTTAVAGAAVEAEAVSSHSAGEGLSSAAAALQHSGLTSLVLDFGALLQVPQSFASGGADADEADSKEPIRAFGELLRFLAAQRMAGCLREALAPLQRAGVQLPLSLGEDQDSAVAAATASGDGAVLHARRQTAAEDPLPPPAQAPNTAPACDVPGHCSEQEPQAAGAAGTAGTSAQPPRRSQLMPTSEPPRGQPAALGLEGDEGDAVAGGGEQNLQATLGLLGQPEPAVEEAGQARAVQAHGADGQAAASLMPPTAAAGPCGDKSYSSAPGSYPAEETSMLPFAAPSAWPPGSSTVSQLVWWLRVLAFGFPRALPAPTPSQQTGSSSQQPQQDAPSSQPLSLGAAYQAYKAASCRPLDRMSLNLYTGIRVVTTLRTYTSAGLLVRPLIAASAAAAATAARGSAAAATAIAGRGLWRAAQVVVAAAQPPVSCTCPRPYLEGCFRGLTRDDLEMIAQCVYLAVGVLGIVLAACTRLHQRRRNAFLLLRAGLDAAAFMTIALPLPRWPAPLLGFPETWLDSNSRAGVHWLMFGLYEPLTLQLSPYLQAIQALIFVLPLTLLGYHSSGCRWRPALRFGFGHALLALAVSAATDARSRVLYLRRARGGAGSKARLA